jgi:hypothetical protein
MERSVSPPMLLSNSLSSLPQVVKLLSNHSQRQFCVWEQRVLCVLPTASQMRPFYFSTQPYLSATPVLFQLSSCIIPEIRQKVGTEVL